MSENGALAIHTGRTLTADGDLVAAWLEFERQEGQSVNTLHAYRKGLAVWAAWLIECGQPDPVLPDHVRQFKADLAGKYGAQTVNLRLSAVRSFYRFLVSTGRTLINPARDVRGAKRKGSQRHKRDALTGQEVRGTLDTCDLGTLEGARDAAILTLFAYCGLRTCEAQRANIGDLRTVGDRLTLLVQGKGRSEKDEIVVIQRNQEAILRRWLSHRRTFKDAGKDGPLFVSLSNRTRGRRLSLQAIRAMVKTRYALAGVVGDSKSTHSLRHSAITAAIRGGATPMQVQAMARHSSFDTTLGYYHETARTDNPAEDLICY